MSATLEVHCAVTNPGDQVACVGNCDTLGSWNVSNARTLSTAASTFPTWSAALPLVPGGTEFKIVILRKSGGADWEAIDGNRRWPSDPEPGNGDIIRCTYSDSRVVVVHRQEEPEEVSPVSNLRSTRLLSVCDVKITQEIAENIAREMQEQEDEDSSESDEEEAKEEEPLVMHRFVSLSPGHTQFITDNRGKIEDAYDMDAALGSGTFGSVSKATNKRTGVCRAVKCIHKVRIGDVAQFKQEVEIMKMMDHPNVIKLFECFEDTSNMYLVMELCNGGDLFDRIIAEHKFSEPKAAVVMRQILRGIYYMHERGVMHRDIKPENFLFSTPETLEESTLKIIDFGLSKKFVKGQPLKTKLGTPNYVAPEVLSGRYTEAADLWGCGVILYIMLCGYPPFNGNTDAEILRKVKLGRFSFDASSWGLVSTEAKRLVGMLLNLNVFERYTACQALQHSWLKDGPPEAESSLELGANLMDNLRQYRSENAFKKATLQLIAWRFLSEDRIENLKKAFRSLDANGDGVLSLDEIKDGLIKGGLTDLPADLQQVVNAVDADGSGTIDYTEFLAATIDRWTVELNEDVLQSAFRLFDKDGNGKIDAQELRVVLQPDDATVEQMGLTKGAADALLDSKVKKLMEEVDENGDGTIDFPEFVQMMRGTLAATAA